MEKIRTTTAASLPDRQKWSLWRAALYGLVVQIIVSMIGNLADGGKDVSLWLQARPGEMIGYFGGQLFACPLLFVLIAFIRNWFIKAKNPSIRADESLLTNKDDEEVQRAIRIKFLCQVTMPSAEVVRSKDRSNAEFDYEEKLYHDRKRVVLELARSITNEGARSFALWCIIDLCVAAGELGQAKELLASVNVDFIREKIIDEHPQLSRL